jgi:hypothetical protein
LDKRLTKSQRKNPAHLRELVNPSITILKSNFDQLPQWEQLWTTFLSKEHSLTLEGPERFDCFDGSEWLCLVRNEEVDVIQDWVRSHQFPL